MYKNHSPVDLAMIPKSIAGDAIRTHPNMENIVVRLAMAVVLIDRIR